MTKKKGLKDAYSLKTPEDSINLYKTWASTYDDDFAKQNDYRSPIEIAKYFEKYSNDETTKNLGGDLGWIDPNSFSIPEIGQVLKHIKINECSPPVNSSMGFHLIWIDKIKKGGKPTVLNNWVEIESMALNKKKMDWYENWIKKSRKDIYIKVLN